MNHLSRRSYLFLNCASVTIYILVVSVIHPCSMQRIVLACLWTAWSPVYGLNTMQPGVCLRHAQYAWLLSYLPPVIRRQLAVDHPQRWYCQNSYECIWNWWIKVIKVIRRQFKFIYDDLPIHRLTILWAWIGAQLNTLGPFKRYVTLFPGNLTPTYPLVMIIALNRVHLRNAFFRESWHPPTPPPPLHYVILEWPLCAKKHRKLRSRDYKQISPFLCSDWVSYSTKFQTQRTKYYKGFWVEKCAKLWGWVGQFYVNFLL